MREFDPINNPLSGINLIEASAGTGKTFSIQKIIMRLILENKIPLEKILVVTFTEAATEELRNKIRGDLQSALAYLERAGNVQVDEISEVILKKFSLEEKSAAEAMARLRLALLDFDTSFICTIHGFCKRMLEECAFEAGINFQTELLSDQTEMISSIVDDFWRKRFYGSNILLAAVAEKVKMSRKDLLSLSKKLVKPGIRPDLNPKERTTDRVIETFEKILSVWGKEKDKILQIIKELLEGKLLSRAKENFSYDKLRNLTDLLNGLPDSANRMLSKNDIDLLLSFSQSSIDAAKTQRGRLSVFPPHEFFKKCEELKGAVAEFNLDLKIEFYHYLESELLSKKKSGNIRTFDDLMLDLRHALKSSNRLKEAVGGKFKAVMIDEFQDTDPVQYEIFKLLFMEPSANFATERPLVFLIGDPKQAIYSFRSADVFTYFKAAEDVDQKNMLPVNFRSSSKFVDDMNNFFSAEEGSGVNHFVLDHMKYEKVRSSTESKGNRRNLFINGEESSGIKIFWKSPSEDMSVADSKRDVYRSVVSEIKRLLSLATQKKAVFRGSEGEQPLKPSDFAVLTRDNDEAAKMKEYMDLVGIPVVLKHTGTVFETDEAMLMEIFLKACVEPGNRGALLAILGSKLFSCDINAMIMEESGKDSGKTALDEWRDSFFNYNQIWQAGSFMCAFRSFLNETRASHDGCDLRSRLLKYYDGERALANIMHIAELLHEAEINDKLGMHALLNWLSKRKAEPEKFQGEESFLIRLERDDEAVKIMTIHKSKGLEFPIVFCPFVAHHSIKSAEEDFIYHENFDRLIHFGSDESMEITKRTNLENFSEMMRLFYVAITRARSIAYIYGGRIRNIDYTPLGYMLLAPSKNNSAANGTASEFERYIEDISKISKNRKLPEDSLEKMEENLADAQSYPEPDLDSKYSFIPENPVLVQNEKIFKGSVDLNWRISSFTSISKYVPEMEYAGDLFESDPYDEGNSQVEAPIENATVRQFWKMLPSQVPAVTVGNCVHKIFEIIDFKADDAEIRRKIQRPISISIASSNALIDPALEMIRGVLDERLFVEGAEFALAEIAMSERLSEIGFYYPLKDFSAEKTAEAFAKYSSDETVRQLFPKRLMALSKNRKLHGFMNGKMDLVFKSKNKFYVLDWKTNKIIDSNVESYSPENVIGKMIENLYILQSCIYAKALDKILSKEIKSYEYEKDFGGVIYLFLRGVGEKTDDGRQTGLFFDKPDPRILETI
ncbi:MAG TPA: exodeoxyribonuclease V subunit beta [Victivallales bacterium]|nr:exodeoxyribonuclease V subunit beta [Victivallales bacterium]